ncbi:MAG: hypothetical protein ACO1OB_16435 [Archangium sp.]
MWRLIILSAVFSGCAVVYDEKTSIFGRAPRDVPPCAVDIAREGDVSQLKLLATRTIEGSGYLTPSDVDRIVTSEACAIGADVALITSEQYGIPFVGSRAAASFYTR